MKNAIQHVKDSISCGLLFSCLFCLVLVTASFVLPPTAQAVSPPPDGGYAGANTAEGTSALLDLNGGTNNTAIGWASLGFDVTGSLNTSVGAGTLLFNSADENTAVGAGALLSNTTGSENTANGAFALFSNTTGTANTSIGWQTLFSNTTASGNTAIGWRALANNSTGGTNTAIGFNAGSNVTTANDVICIGPVYGANVSDSCYIANIWGATIDPGTALSVIVDTNGKLGTTLSSRHFKHDIKPMDQASEGVLALKPVTFEYKNDKKKTLQFGLIAEEVAKVNPNLVVRDKTGELLTVRYDQVNAMLLNEFLKEHKAFVEQKQRVQELEATVASIAVMVKGQAVQLQKLTMGSARTHRGREWQ